MGIRRYLVYVLFLVVAARACAYWYLHPEFRFSLFESPQPHITNPVNPPESRTERIDGMREFKIIPQSYHLFENAAGKRFVVYSSEFYEHTHQIIFLQVRINDQAACYFFFDTEKKTLRAGGDLYVCDFNQESNKMYLLIPEDWVEHPVPNL